MGILVQRPARAVQHQAGLVLFGRHVPQFLETDAVVLGILALVQAEFPNQALADVATGALGEQGVLGAKFHARHVAAFLAAIGGHAHVADQDAAHHAVLDDSVLGGEAREDLDAQRLRLLGQPAAQVTGADHVAGDVTTGVVHALGHQRVGQLLGLLGILEQVQLITYRRGGQRGAALLPVGEQLEQGAGLEHRPGQNMGAHLGALLDHADGQLLLGLVGLLHQAAGGGQSRRTGADDDHVELHGVAFYLFCHRVLSSSA